MTSPTSDIMMKYVFTALILFATTAVFAQKRIQNPNNPQPNNQVKDTTSALTKALKNATPTTQPEKPGKKDWSKVRPDPRKAQDHFMFELGYDNWVGSTDSMNIKGFNHSENFYFMYSWPFKSDGRLSLAAGVGLGSSNIYFAHQEVLVTGFANNVNQTLAFPNEEGGPHFKRYKLTTTYFEFPVELRFAADPTNMDHTWKFAVRRQDRLDGERIYQGCGPGECAGGIRGRIYRKRKLHTFFQHRRIHPYDPGQQGCYRLFCADPRQPADQGLRGTVGIPRIRRDRSEWVIERFA